MKLSEILDSQIKELESEIQHMSEKIDYLDAINQPYGAISKELEKKRETLAALKKFIQN